MWLCCLMGAVVYGALVSSTGHVPLPHSLPATFPRCAVLGHRECSWPPVFGDQRRLDSSKGQQLQHFQSKILWFISKVFGQDILVFHWNVKIFCVAGTLSPPLLVSTVKLFVSHYVEFNATPLVE